MGIKFSLLVAPGGLGMVVYQTKKNGFSGDHA
jgi:hypothetical protein